MKAAAIFIVKGGGVVCGVGLGWLGRWDEKEWRKNQVDGGLSPGRLNVPYKYTSSSITVCSVCLWPCPSCPPACVVVVVVVVVSPNSNEGGNGGEMSKPVPLLPPGYLFNHFGFSLSPFPTPHALCVASSPARRKRRTAIRKKGEAARRAQPSLWGFWWI